MEAESNTMSSQLGNIGERLSKLEEKVNSAERERETARREYREDMTVLFAKVDAVRAELAKHSPCPSPGSCLELKPKIEDHEKRLRVAEAARERMIGERTIIGAACGIIGAVLVSIFNWFLGGHK